MSEEKLTRAAVVTGGSRGIGRAVCLALAKQGCNVVVNYCHGEAAAAETAALCKEQGVEAVTVQADVSTAEGCKKLFEEAVNAFGRVDILVNNAGVTRDNLILRLSEEDFDTVLNANLKGAFLCCKEAARRMVRQRYGRIVNLSSVVGLRGNAGQMCIRDRPGRCGAEHGSGGRFRCLHPRRGAGQHEDRRRHLQLPDCTR